MKKRILTLFLACTMAASLFAGCGTYTDDSSSGSGSESAAATETGKADSATTASAGSDTLNVAAGTALTLNQFTSQASNDYDALYLLMSSLVRYYDDKVENDAAESYDVSDDGLTYTFHLRDGLKYSDGTAIKAEDFKYAIMQTIKPDSGASSASYYLGIAGAADYNSGSGTADAVGVAAPDDKTLTITLAAANDAFIKSIAIYPVFPVTQSFAKAQGDQYGTSAETTLFSGPYTLKEWTIDTSMTFEKNNDWWNAKDEFPMKTINVLNISSANTKVSMFQNKELDVVATLDPNYAATLGDVVKQYEGSTEMLLWIKEKGTSDEATKVLDNDNFRKALTYALDREAVGAAVNKGFVGTNRAVSSNYMTDGGKFIDKYPVDAIPVKGDAAKAKEYLAKALTELGYKDASELPKMTYMGFERDDMKLLGEAIVDTWKQTLGITSIQFVQYPIATAIQNFYQGNYDLFMISLGCSVAPDDIIKGFTKTGDYAFFTENWATDITDTIAAANSEKFDSDAYNKKIAEAEQALLNENSIVPLYNQTFFYALADGVKGYVEPGTVFQFQFNHLTKGN